MAKRYTKLYYDLIDSLTPLGDAERGRLLTAMLEYASRGAEPEFRGNERFIWPAIKGQIDREMDAYSQRCDQNRENVNSRWGKKACTNRNESYKKNTKTYESYQDEDKDKDQDEEEERARDGCGFLSDSEADALSEKAQSLSAVFDVAERAGFPHTQADLDRLNPIVADYGPEAVINAIGHAVDQGESKRTWAYLRGILKSDPTGGAKPKEEAYAPKPHWEDER